VMISFVCNIYPAWLVSKRTSNSGLKEWIWNDLLCLQCYWCWMKYLFEWMEFALSDFVCFCTRGW
jgi:hypothetical protein